MFVRGPVFARGGADGGAVEAARGEDRGGPFEEVPAERLVGAFLIGDVVVYGRTGG